MSQANDVEWRDSPVFGERYEVSRLGVRNKETGRVLRPRPSKDGYPLVNLRMPGVQKTRPVHRLVAEAFHGPCPDGMECRHLDGDKLNFRPRNLRWGTRAENTADKIRHGSQVRGERQGGAKMLSVDVRLMRARRRAYGHSFARLGRQFGVSASASADVCNRKTWAHIP